MKFSFIHTADIHLGRPFSDLPNLDDKTELCNRAVMRAFDKIVDVALAKNVDFVLIAGDSFDNDEHDLSTKRKFINNLMKLADNNIKSYVICGNHDPIELYKKYQSYFRFDKKYDEFIHITGVTTDDYKCSFSPAEGVNIHTVSFKSDESPNQAADLPLLNSDMEKCFNIGLLHCDLDKTDSKYAPVSREDLKRTGYDYYALGHIHIPELKENNIVYAGSPQARTRKETGEHGCYYVQVCDKNIENIEFVPADYVRFTDMEVDCSDALNKLEIYNKISESLENNCSNVELNLFNVTLKGITKAFEELNETESLVTEYIENYGQANRRFEVYKINNETMPDVDEKLLAEDNGIIGLVAKCFDENSEIDVENIYKNISELHENIYKKLGLDTESKEFLSSSLTVDKEEILNNVRKEIQLLCKEIYTLE
ncbi:MAG: DNA repair exonuclease [Cyanobacteria bacterium RUI128]|nr:DNA repair exonuclease [Cyanobacteria bacterium RUI128]